uniref:Uncharacterized protein n=1 Tax=Glycine max TaxID=3847 RepID=C6TDW5_SOYBN|nr:unknown [Glycine max]
MMMINAILKSNMDKALKSSFHISRKRKSFLPIILSSMTTS